MSDFRKKTWRERLANQLGVKELTFKALYHAACVNLCAQISDDRFHDERLEQRLKAMSDAHWQNNRKWFRLFGLMMLGVVVNAGFFVQSCLKVENPARVEADGFSTLAIQQWMSGVGLSLSIVLAAYFAFMILRHYFGVSLFGTNSGSDNNAAA